MVINDNGKNTNMQDKRVDPIRQCKERIFPPTRLEIGIKEEFPEKKVVSKTHSEKTSITFMVPQQISSQVASPEMMIVSSKSALTSIKNPVTPFPQYLYMNCPIQLHFLAIPKTCL
jgi:hypothetical protein